MEKITTKRVRNDKLNIEKYFGKEQNDASKKRGNYAIKRKNISFKESKSEDLLKKTIKKIRREDVTKRGRKYCSYSGVSTTLINKEKDGTNVTTDKNVGRDEMDTQMHMETETQADFKSKQLLRGRGRRGKGSIERDVIDEYIRTKKRKEKNEIIAEQKKENQFRDTGVLKDVQEDEEGETIIETTYNGHYNDNINGECKDDNRNGNNSGDVDNGSNNNNNNNESNEANDTEIMDRNNYALKKSNKRCNLRSFSNKEDRNVRHVKNHESRNLFQSHNNAHINSQAQQSIYSNALLKQERGATSNVYPNENKISNEISVHYTSQLKKKRDAEVQEVRRGLVSRHAEENNNDDTNIHENTLETSNLCNSKSFVKFGLHNRKEVLVETSKIHQSSTLENENSTTTNLGSTNIESTHENGVSRNMSKSIYVDSTKSNNEKSSEGALYSYADRMKDHLNAMGLKINSRSKERLEKASTPLKKGKNAAELFYSNSDGILKNTTNYGSILSDEFLSKILRDYYSNSSSNMLDTLNDLHYFMRIANNPDAYSYNSLSNSSNTNNNVHSMYDLGSFFPCLIENGGDTDMEENAHNGDSTSKDEESNSRKNTEKNMREMEEELLGEKEKETRDLYLNHSDLLINKREKRSLHEDENKENDTENFRNNFWRINKKRFFDKYTTSSLNLTKEEVEKFKELLPLHKHQEEEEAEEEKEEEEREEGEEQSEEDKEKDGKSAEEKRKKVNDRRVRQQEESEDEEEEDEEIDTQEDEENNMHSYSCDDSYTINDLFSCANIYGDNNTYARDSLHIADTENEEPYKEIDMEIGTKKHITDVKLKGFQLEMMNGFLYDKQSAYEKEILKNHKLFAHISNEYKNTNVNVEKILHLFPRDFIKKYKVTKKLGQGVYGKVFNAESLDDSYLNFAIKSLRYFWPNFKFKFGLEEFACNELNIMRHIMHPNVVCLLDHFRVRTFRKDRYANNRSHRYKGSSMNNGESEEYDFSTQKTDRTEHIRFFPSDETYRKNEKYNAIISKNKMTIEQMESQLIMDSVNCEQVKPSTHTKKDTILKSIKTEKEKEERYQNKENSFNESYNESQDTTLLKTEKCYGTEEGNGIATNDETLDNSNYSNSNIKTHSTLNSYTYGCHLTNEYNCKDNNSNMQRNSNPSSSNRNMENTTDSKGNSYVNSKRESQKKSVLYTFKSKKEKKKKLEIKDRLIDKLQYRKFSRNYKKIENLNYDYVENWNLFLVMEKCDYALSEILEQMRNKYFRFLQGIKNQVSNLFAGKKVEICYEHLYNYVKHVYLPSKKESGKIFYPDFPALTETQTKVVIYQMLQGINQIHKEFVIHRDIKPANTLIKNIQYLSDGLNDSKEWVIKIGDFGLSIHDKFFQPEKKDSNIITLQYRPPEIMCNNDIYNYSVDIWSVGMTMCECLLGFVPVASKFDSSVLYKILVFRGIPKQYFSDLLKDQFIGELPNFDTDRLKMLHLIFTDIYGRKLLSDDGIDLIDKFLSYDYKTRITANEALKHKWFKDIALHMNEDLLQFYKESGTYYF